ncbi:MAG: ATP-binding protein [Myxococcota bacterium]
MSASGDPRLAAERALLRADLRFVALSISLCATLIVGHVLFDQPSVPAVVAGVSMTALVSLALDRYRMWQLLQERRAAPTVVPGLEASIADLAPALIWVTDAESRFIYVNQATLAHSGKSAAELLGAPGFSTVHPDDVEKLRQRRAAEIAKHQSWRDEVRVRSADGAYRWVSFHVVPRFEGGQFVGQIAIGVDTTERKQQEQALVEQTEAAAASSKLKSEFLAKMSHEIRTPMNGVIGMTDLLCATALDGDQRYYASTIRSSAEALLTIINDILDYSKIEAHRLRIEPVDFDLRTELDALVEILKLKAEEKGIALALHFPPELQATVRGDWSRIRQILTNLIANAIKFTDRGGVEVRVQPTESAGDKVNLAFSVRDTGIGIPQEQQGNVFLPFMQADGESRRRQGGTGLGLAISRELAELMGGQLLLESRPGVGTTFTVVLPLERSAKHLSAPPRHGTRSLDPKRPPKLAVVEERPFVGLRVLVAEDNLVNQRVITRVLENMGCVVECVADGDAAVRASEDPSFAVILMDLQMPLCDGTEATRRIRARELTTGKHVPIVALTADAMSGDRERCLKAGMDDYVSKPFRAGDVQQALERLQATADVNLLESAG